jgi:putative ABC transport system permease protein
MNCRDTSRTALEGVRTNTSRSLLTILGIVIGVTAIVLVASVGASAEGIIVGELGGLGAETIVVRPGKEPSGPSDFAEVLFADSLKERELVALSKKQNVPHLVDISPEIIVTGSASYRGETFKPLILGFSADFMLNTLRLELGTGVAFDERDERSKAKVVVIGSRVAEELFGSEDALGKNIILGDQKFRVIGVFAPRGQVVFFDVDELALIPYTTAQTYLVGRDYYNQIIVQAENAEVVDATVIDIKRTLRSLHRIEEGDEDDFYVQTQQGLVEQVQTIIGVFTMFLAFVVAIALVVGGIGVMNIMLVSVTERTREIGLRKALGATNRDILSQFLTEAIILTGVGGLIGIALAALLSFVVGLLVSSYTSFTWVFSFPIPTALLGLGVSTLVGLVFGIYPARKASRKSPMEALRYE